MKELKRSCMMGRLRALPRAVLSAFVCCFLAGYLVHLFAFTNILPNADGISRISDPQQMTISGRWFLHYATAWNGFLQAPALIGFLSVLFLALASAFTVSLIRVRSAWIGGLIGVLMIVFPSVAFTYLYLFTASAYCFGILLAVLAVWLTVRYRFGFLPGILLLACSVGTYQAYLAVAASLALLSLILSALDDKKKGIRILLSALKMLLFLVLGLVVYYLVLRLFLRVKDLTLLSYKGIGVFGKDLTVRGVLEQIRAAYGKFVQYFFVPRSFALYTTPVTVVGNALLALAGILAFVLLVIRNRLWKRPFAFACVIVLCAILPLGLNLTVLMDEAMPIMRYALVFCYVFALALVDRTAESRARNKDNGPHAADDGLRQTAPPAERGPEQEGETPSSEGDLQTSPAGGKSPASSGRSFLLRPLALCAGLLLFLVSFQTDNLVYTMSATAHRATESFATRLVERVESTPGYEDGMEVVIIGGFPRSSYYSQIEAFKEIEDYSNLSSTVTPLTKQVYYYLNDWLNVPWPEPSEETLIAVSDSAAFREMPLYPSDGGIVISDGRVIVKLAKRYTPKKDYEIAYENRR